MSFIQSEHPFLKLPKYFHLTGHKVAALPIVFIAMVHWVASTHWMHLRRVTRKLYLKLVLNR